MKDFLVRLRNALRALRGDVPEVSFYAIIDGKPIMIGTRFGVRSLRSVNVRNVTVWIRDLDEKEIYSMLSNIPYESVKK